MSSRYIPSLETLVRATQELPLAESWRSDTYHVPVTGERLLEFKRIKIKGKGGRAAESWIYEGKVRVK